MNSTTSSNTKNFILRDIFAKMGLPKQIVSDKGLQFISEKFKTLTKMNIIKHIASFPYHPRTNGSAERFVQRFKYASKKESKTIPLNAMSEPIFVHYLTTGEMYGTQEVK